jgi:predicted outer membrane protein
MALLEAERQDLRRLIEAQIEAAKAAKRSGDEAASSAKYAKRMVRWMAASVFVATLSLVASCVFDLLTYLRGSGGG